MKFLHKDSTVVDINDDIKLNEYCAKDLKLPIDGAYARINGSLGPKINKTFSELFFVISGQLEIEYDGMTHLLKEKDMCIIVPNKPHRINGLDCEVFISCSPQFNEHDVEFI